MQPLVEPEITGEMNLKLEAKVERLIEKNRQLSEQLGKSLKAIARLRRQRSALLDMIADKQEKNSQLFDYDDDEDDNSSAYEEDMDLGELSEPSPEESSESASESSEEEIPFMVTPLASAGNKRRRAPGAASAEDGVTRKGRHRLVVVDKNQEGEYNLPIQLGNIKLIDLGRIISSPPTYHNNRYIFPVGYQVERVYKSMKDPSKMTTYTCTIKEGPNGPKFCIVGQDMPEVEIEKDTPTAAWTAVMKEANKDRQRANFAVSGPEYFGMSHPTIAKMIQELPGAEKCVNYVWRTFDDIPSTPASPAPAAKKPRPSPSNETPEESPRSPSESSVASNRDNSKNRGKNRPKKSA